MGKKEDYIPFSLLCRWERHQNDIRMTISEGILQLDVRDENWFDPVQLKIQWRTFVTMNLRVP